MNVIAQLEFEPTYLEGEIQQFTHYTTTPLIDLFDRKVLEFIFMSISVKAYVL